MQPFNSGFALHDGHLTIEHIIQSNLGNPEFTYISGCHTTMWKVENPDEVAHLAGAMLFVGFCSVIGTMCAVDEGQMNKVTLAFYKHMVDGADHLNHTRAMLVLDRMLKELRDVVPIDQRILYVHIGA
ncbi:hypothetical protein JVU11DRAFT_10978 [Chiua virens]|nr:hypothetical protein JVU11DRAFT_10978 [Chiua virens]